MLEEGYHIAGADRRELGFAVAEPMVEEPVGKAPGMKDRAGTDPALPNQILFIIDAHGCPGDLPRCRDRSGHPVAGDSMGAKRYGDNLDNVGPPPVTRDLADGSP